MSFMAMEWARTAPVANATERAILIELAHRASDDGTDAFPAKKRMAEVAVCHAKTVQDNLTEMRRRGLVRPGNQEAAYYLPAHARPVVYDLQIPVAWYSKEQLAKVNQDRADKGLGPLTSDNRPQLGDAPKRKHPLKGQPRPPRKGESQDQEQGVHGSDDEDPTGRGEQYAPGEHKAPREHGAPKGGAQSSPGGEHDAPRTCPLNPSDKPVLNSSSSPPPSTDRVERDRAEEEDENPVSSPGSDTADGVQAPVGDRTWLGEPRGLVMACFWESMPDQLTPGTQRSRQRVADAVWELFATTAWGEYSDGPDLLADWFYSRIPEGAIKSLPKWLLSQLEHVPSAPDRDAPQSREECDCDEDGWITVEDEHGHERVRRCPKRHRRSQPKPDPEIQAQILGSLNEAAQAQGAAPVGMPALLEGDRVSASGDIIPPF